MRNVVIASAVRTAVGNFNGSLASIPPIELGAVVIKEAINRAGINPSYIDEVLMGNVLQAGLGQNPARQSAVKAGIPVEIPSMTINKVCGSGLRCISLAFQFISAGYADIIVAGGMENMSQAPFLLKNARWGYRMGDNILMDSMVHDGLTDIFNNYHMGITAENLAEKYNISRDEQDTFAVESQNKAEEAIRQGYFNSEITPVNVPQKKREPRAFDIDESPRFGTTVDALSKLKPAFKKDGTVTAGNASGINDGAAALVILSEEKALEYKIKPMAKIVTFASAGVDPSVMGLGPVPATRKALKRANLTLKDIDLIEANEAFAAQAIAVSRELNFDMDRVNVNGGAIALGHPIGASGARILVTLLYEMKRRNVKYGLSTLCIGGGMGTSLIVEKYS